jgi:hypothetical protein
MQKQKQQPPVCVFESVCVEFLCLSQVSYTQQGPSRLCALRRTTSASCHPTQEGTGRRRSRAQQTRCRGRRCAMPSMQYEEALAFLQKSNTKDGSSVYEHLTRVVAKVGHMPCAQGCAPATHAGRATAIVACHYAMQPMHAACALRAELHASHRCWRSSPTRRWICWRRRCSPKSPTSTRTPRSRAPSCPSR